MEQPFFSIVMPVYNVENYLNQAVGSVLNQTFGDFEVLLIDDCSPDRSGEICDELAQQDERVRVIHLPQNGGLSNARNTGLEAAKGKFITFSDSDDWVDTNLYQTVYDSLQENYAEVTVFGLVEEYFDKNNEKIRAYEVTYGKPEILRNTDAVRPEVIHLEEKTLLGYAWNKFYNLQMLRDNRISFKTIPLIEDILFNVEVCRFATKMNILDIAPYHYMKRIDHSLTNKFVPDYYSLHKQRVEAVLNLYRSWGLCTDGVKKILADIYVRYLFSALQRNCDPRSGMSHNMRKEFIKAVYEDVFFQELVPYAAPGSKAVKMMSALVNHHSVAATLCLARLIYVVKTKCPALFSKAKQMR